MRLSENDIKHEMETDRLDISGDPHIGPSSVDLQLGNEYEYPPSGKEIDLRNYTADDMSGYANDTITIGPHNSGKEAVLCTTKERVDLPNHIDADVKGRSSIGRLFVIVHTAGYVDAGYAGEITLELVNHSSNTYHIPVGMRVCQLTFNYLNTPCDTGYNDRADSKYAEQQGATASKISEDF